MQIIKQFFNGRSGASTYLANKDGTLGVFKTNIKSTDGIIDIQNSLPFKTPNIFDIGKHHIFMEYIPGISIKEYLYTFGNSAVLHISDFICQYIDFCNSKTLCNYDYSSEIYSKIEQLSLYVPKSCFDITSTVFPKSVVHGDLTFDNLIYYNKSIYMIDASVTVFDSVHFELNKLQQDLKGLWFVRYETDRKLWDHYCRSIYNIVTSRHPNIFNDNIYRLMVSRVLPYCKNNHFETRYINNMFLEAK